jgi:lysophospholipase L1-like esterase
LSLLLILIGSAVGLVVCEFAVRIFAPQALTSDVIMGDPDVDYRLRPNARGHMSSPEYSADIRINSLGFRGAEISPVKRPGMTRVLFLGDSFTFGHGLSENETLPYLVGRDLEHNYPGKFEVINGGVYGYSTADELNFLKKFGVPLQPDVVVTLLMTNDFDDNVVGYKLGSGGELIKQKTSSDYTRSRRITRFIPGANWLRAHSHLFKFLGVRLLPVLTSGKLPAADEQANAGPKQLSSYPEFQPQFYEARGGPFEVTRAILAEMARTAQTVGARSLLLTLGGAYEFRDGRLQPEAMVFHSRSGRAALRSGFSRTLALSPLLSRYRGQELLFFPKDTHWTATATQFVAPAVAKAVAETARPRKSPMTKKSTG